MIGEHQVHQAARAAAGKKSASVVCSRVRVTGRTVVPTTAYSLILEVTKI